MIPLIVAGGILVPGNIEKTAARAVVAWRGRLLSMLVGIEVASLQFVFGDCKSLGQKNRQLQADCTASVCART